MLKAVLEEGHPRNGIHGLEHGSMNSESTLETGFSSLSING